MKRQPELTRVITIYMGAVRNPGACEIYRGDMPMHFLGQQPGWAASWTWFGDLWEQYRKRGAAAWQDVIEQNDIFVFPRVYIPDEPSKQALAAFYSLLRLAGKRIVYETDDDYTNEHRPVVDGDSLTPARWSDAITVTTPYLADLMKKRTKRPVYVLPNCIDPALWRDGCAPERHETMKDTVLIGLTGSATHYGDWQVLAPVLRELMDANPNSHLIVMGFHPDYLSNLPRTTYLPGYTYTRYAQVIRGCDIILAPVNPSDPFNMGKSPIKAVEGQAAQRLLDNGYPAGAAVIATDNPIYRLAVKHGKTGLLVQHTPEAWRDAVQALITCTELRHELQVKGFQSVYRHYDITKEWTQWAKAYRRILAAPPNPCTLLV
jgi:glycosyltransferase involved in cell wall biosynthesis